MCLDGDPARVSPQDRRLSGDGGDDRTFQARATDEGHRNNPARDDRHARFHEHGHGLRESEWESR